MKHIDRPTQITTILKTIGSGDDAEIRVELETYVAELESRQPDRPGRIKAILKTIGSQYSADVAATLEVYISDLEARQMAVLPDDDYAPSQNPDNPPYWSHVYMVERENRRRERALRKQNNYQ
jgi:hypothetical protein